jgi:hypothetical protein
MAETNSDLPIENKKAEEKRIITYRYDKDMFNNFGDQQAMIEYVTPFLKGEGSPFKKPEDGIKVLLSAKELNVPFSVALSHSFIVNNKVAHDTHFIRGLAQRGGIAMTTVEDYRPLYSYRYRDSTFLQDEIDQNPNTYKVFTSAAVLGDYVNTKRGKEDFDNGIIPVLRAEKPYDYRTTIRFEREFQLKNGRFVHLVEDASFTYSEAKKAELVDKNNWKKYGRDCLYARSTTRGLRRIAGDIVHGILTKDEFGLIDDNDDPDSFQDYEVIQD